MEHKVEQPRCRQCGLVAPSASQGPLRVVCESAAMRELFRRTAKFARNEAPVVIIGESGTGKEVVARTLHANSSRADKPFIAVNVAAIPDDLIESEFFGHAQGAFTGAGQAKTGLFEAAHGGTLFLDEIGELPLSLQAKLLRALQDGEVRRVGETRSRSVNVRVLCATHRPLLDLMRAGKFREDLYYRLKVLSLKLPPLRDRKDDILPLARQFLAAEGNRARKFTAQAEKELLAHSWPGNVRELQNAARYVAALATEDAVGADLLPDEVRDGAKGLAVGKHGRPSERGVLRPLEEVEREHVFAVLQACGGSASEAARVLGIGRNTLWRKLQRYGT